MTWAEIPDEVDALVRDYTAIPKAGGGVAMSNVAGYVIDRLRECSAKGHAWKKAHDFEQDRANAEALKREAAETELVRFHNALLALPVPLPEEFRTFLDSDALRRAIKEHEALVQYATDWHKHADGLVEQRDASRHAIDRLLTPEFEAEVRDIVDGLESRTAGDRIMRLIRDRIQV